MPERQTQRAGDGSQLVQVAGDYVVQGVSEERAAEIARAQAREVIKQELTAEAQAIGDDRISRFDDSLVENLAKGGVLDAFADPGFQVLLKKAQLGAASTEREDDQALLVRLLGERAAHPSHPVRAAVDRAVQVIALIDDVALRGLTMAWMIESVVSTAGLIQIGLTGLEESYASIGPDALPAGNRWMDHLDTLDCLRVSQVGGLKKFLAFFTERMPGYAVAGLDDTETEDLRARLALISGKLPGLVVPHELQEGTSRFAYASADTLAKGFPMSALGLTPGEAEQIRVLLSEPRYSVQHADCVAALEESMLARSAIATAKSWWDEIPHGFSLTSVGKAVAYANVTRHTHSIELPPLDDYLGM